VRCCHQKRHALKVVALDSSNIGKMFERVGYSGPDCDSFAFMSQKPLMQPVQYERCLKYVILRIAIEQPSECKTLEQARRLVDDMIRVMRVGASQETHVLGHRGGARQVHNK
jgi:hypothetical protein